MPDVFSEIEVELWGVRATLRNPIPFREEWSYWVCHDPATKRILDVETVRAMEDGEVVMSPYGHGNWAVDVGRVVARRLGATIIREKPFDLAEWARYLVEPDPNIAT